eukprot:TRINITY_DN19798_c0_g1_i1.p1 TRINITY_DN19798_c0_g1~~TRINITY_DN19798_c0_g1_i1.p1  ORF type:complete len:442 (+),score=97.33 TRINITY_DN19798_c0_g1_i1:402-1727(+)
MRAETKQDEIECRESSVSACLKDDMDIGEALGRPELEDKCGRKIALEKPTATVVPTLKESAQCSSVDQNDNLHAFLSKFDLMDLEEIFQRQNITLEDVLEMDKEEMREVGIKAYKQRKLLWRAIQDQLAGELPDNGPAHGFISSRTTPRLIHGEGRTQGLNSERRQDAMLPEFVPSIRTENTQTLVSALRSKFSQPGQDQQMKEPVQTSAPASKNIDNFPSPDRKQEFPSAFNISSTGSAKNDRPSYLGLYTITADTYHNQPVYKHQAEELYLFLGSDDNWRVYFEPNPSNADWMFAPKGSTSNLPPTSGWEYLPPTKVDSTASVLAIQGSAAYNISSSGIIKDKYPTALGLYTQDGDKMYNDRPVYKHNNQSVYLFVDSTGYWSVNSKLAEAASWFYAYKKSALPPATGWVMKTGWISDPSLTVRGVWGGCDDYSVTGTK